VGSAWVRGLDPAAHSERATADSCTRRPEHGGGAATAWGRWGLRGVIYLRGMRGQGLHFKQVFAGGAQRRGMTGPKTATSRAWRHAAFGRDSWVDDGAAVQDAGAGESFKAGRNFAG